ncbi:MAG: nucleotide sugar dehydrogenase [Christensenellales bacterium]
MNLYEAILRRETKLSVVGLGYVGLPLAIAFAQQVEVIGFDIDQRKIDHYRDGKDPTHEVGDEAVAKSTVRFTTDESELRSAKFHIVAVPTPINQDKTPNLHPVIDSSRIVGRNLTRGSIVVYESTVYPGVTEDICVGILEAESGLKCGADFKVGYSPERINPGDKVHTLATIVKIVSGSDEEARKIIASVYKLVVKAGTHAVSNIKTAEAVKVLENSQRDVNIAFINESALVFDRMGIDTSEVIEGMNTKWNALGFRPGLVGGHCIGVDPYYFLYEAEKLGFHSQIIAAARRINDSMGRFVADAAIKTMILAGKVVKGSRVAVLGLTFKEDCPDVRNSKVMDIISRLQEHAIETIVTDALADKDEAFRAYGVELKDLSELRDIDAVVVAVAHKQYRQLSPDEFDGIFRRWDSTQKVMIDVKSIYDRSTFEDRGYAYWTL